MEFLATLFNLAIYQPLYNGLIALYNFIPDLGIAIILLTLLIRIMLISLSKKSIESQKKMQEIQPAIKRLQEKYKNDRAKQSQAIMQLYKEKKINPASGCLPLIIQLVILIALYRVFMAGISFNGDGHLLYSFVKNPGHINHLAFGFIDITKSNLWLALLAAGLQFWQTKMLMTKNEKVQTAKKQLEEKKDSEEPDFSTIMQKQMLYLGPFLTFIFGAKFSAGLPIYWITTTLFMIVQQYWIISKEKTALKAENKSS